MFEFFPEQFSEVMLSYEQFCINYPHEKEDFTLSQKLYNQLSELKKDWIWMLGVGVGNPEINHLVDLFHHASQASDKIQYIIIEAEMAEKPVLFCYLKSTLELVGDCYVPDDYQPTAKHDEALFDNLYQCVKEWKDFKPTALN